MKVLVETESGSSFEIEVDYLDTVLEVKQKIDKSQRIPVSKQILSFDDGMALRDEDDLLDVEKCQIFPHSRLHLFVSPHQNPNHGQTEQREEEIIDDGHQDSTLTVQNRVPKKKMVVYVTPYSGESESSAKPKGIPVDVKMSDNVKEVRNELVRFEEKGELNLPQEGYVLIHKDRLLNENYSFWLAGVDHNDTIQILPRHLTRGSFDSS